MKRVSKKEVNRFVNQKVRAAPATRADLRREVKNVISRTTELHHLNAELNVNVDDAFTVGWVKLSQPIQGDNINQRTGDLIQYTGLYGRMEASVADVFNYIRFIIIQWLPDDAVDTPTAADFFEYAATGFYHYSPVVADRADRSKFKILVDRTLSVSSTGAQSKMINFSAKANKFNLTRFNPAAVTGRGCLYFCYVSDSSSISHPNLKSSFIYTFKNR